MMINRCWAMPNHKTFEIKPIKDLLNRFVKNRSVWIDPFANNSSIAKITNDINPKCKTKYHLDAYEFSKTIKGMFEGVLFDPPYSVHQTNQMYEGYGLRKQASIIMDEIAKKIKKGGYAISFGWNSNGFGKKRGFMIIEILLVAHGGSHNDTIIIVEKKVSTASPITSATPTLAEPKEFNMGDKVTPSASPKDASHPSHHPNIKLNSQVLLQAR